MTKLTFFLTFLGLFTQVAFSHQVPKYSLMELIEKAPIIVSAKVQQVYSNRSKTEVSKLEEAFLKGRIYPKVAELTIYEVLKGQVQTKKLKVDFNPSLMGTARYKANTTVIAFLEPAEEKPHYQTVGFFYGLKELSITEIKLYEEKIKEIQKVLNLADLSLLKKQRTDWLFSCLKQSPSLRIEALYELMDEYNYKVEQDWETGELTPAKLELSVEQKMILRDIILAEKDQHIAESYISLANRIKKKQDPELVSFLAKLLVKTDKTMLLSSKKIMLQIAQCSQDPEIQKLFKPSYSDAQWFKKLSPEKQRAMRLSLPDIQYHRKLSHSELRKFIKILRQRGYLQEK